MKWCAAIGVLLAMSGNLAAQRSTPTILREARFEQVALTTKDLQQAMTFYRDKVGLRLLFESNKMLFFDVGAVRLMIAYDARREDIKRPAGILYFHVDDFAASFHRLNTADVRLIGPVETVSADRNGALRLQQFEDPDGNMLAIMGFVANQQSGSDTL